MRHNSACFQLQDDPFFFIPERKLRVPIWRFLCPYTHYPIRHLLNKRFATHGYRDHLHRGMSALAHLPAWLADYVHAPTWLVGVQAAITFAVPLIATVIAPVGQVASIGRGSTPWMFTSMYRTRRRGTPSSYLSPACHICTSIGRLRILQSFQSRIDAPLF